MSTYGKELLGKVVKDFATSYAKDKKIKSITKKLANNSTSYEDANLYSIRVGELLSKALQGNINANTLSGNFISKELAQEILEPTLANNYNLISQAVLTVQTNQNKASQIGLQPQVAELNTDRIQGLVDKVASYDTLEQGNWVLGEPIVNYSQAIVDDSEAKNMEVYSKAGLEAKIVRVAEHGACRWCRSLAGTYDYAGVRATGSDVYRRHENCRCLVTYENGKHRQDVWSKSKWEVEEDAQRAQELEKLQATQDAIDQNRSILTPPEVGGAKLGLPMTVEQADSGNVNPNFTKIRGGYMTNCQSCVVTYEARLRGYDVEVLPNTKGSMLQTLSSNPALAWLNQDGTPAVHLINGTDEMLERSKKQKPLIKNAKQFETELKDRLVSGERYTLNFPWKGRSRSGHIVNVEISDNKELHIYDPQSNRNYYNEEVSKYLERIKYTSKNPVFGTMQEPVQVMRVDDKVFDLSVVNDIMKLK